MSDTSATAGAPAPATKTGVVVDPYRAYNFKLLIGQQARGHFTRIDGLGVKIERRLHRGGGDAGAARSIPGRVEFTPVTLRYGLTDSTELIQWLFTAFDNKVRRQNVSVVMLNESGLDEVRRWNLLEAWPCAWFGAPLDSMGNDLAIESLTLAYDRLELDGAPATVA